MTPNVDMLNYTKTGSPMPAEDAERAVKLLDMASFEAAVERYLQINTALDAKYYPRAISPVVISFQMR